MNEEYYSVGQIADMLHMHPKTIQRYIREGRLMAQKLGKAWRVTGHDLSAFVEGTQAAAATDSAGLHSIIEDAGRDIKVSTVIDIPVQGSDEAVQVANWVSATMNSCPPEYGYKSMTSQYIEPDRVIRIMLWGSLAFTSAIIGSLGELETR